MIFVCYHVRVTIVKVAISVLNPNVLTNKTNTARHVTPNQGNGKQHKPLPSTVQGIQINEKKGGDAYYLHLHLKYLELRSSE